MAASKHKLWQITDVWTAWKKPKSATVISLSGRAWIKARIIGMTDESKICLSLLRVKVQFSNIPKTERIKYSMFYSSSVSCQIILDSNICLMLHCYSHSIYIFPKSTSKNRAVTHQPVFQKYHHLSESRLKPKAAKKPFVFLKLSTFTKHRVFRRDSRRRMLSWIFTHLGTTHS